MIVSLNGVSNLAKQLNSVSPVLWECVRYRQGFHHEPYWYRHWPRWKAYKSPFKIEYQQPGFKTNMKEARLIGVAPKDVPGGLKKAAIRETEAERRARINKLWDDERARQESLIARVDKLQVRLSQSDMLIPEDLRGGTLIMNRHVSTPFNCAQHINELVCHRSAVVQIHDFDSPEDEKYDPSASGSGSSGSGPILWDMHRPMNRDCRIHFCHFTGKDSNLLNKVYWRSCSFVLGMALTRAFKSQVPVYLHSWPKPDPKSGSFIYDVSIQLADVWRPNEEELRALTAVLWDIRDQQLNFERLDVSREVAREILADNPFKSAQIDPMAPDADSTLTLYRVGDHIDVSVGPMISNTRQFGRLNITAIHPFQTRTGSVMYRVQGLSLPQQSPLNPFVYQNILTPRARKLNPAPLPEDGVPIQPESDTNGGLQNKHSAQSAG